MHAFLHDLFAHARMNKCSEIFFQNTIHCNIKNEKSFMHTPKYRKVLPIRPGLDPK